MAELLDMSTSWRRALRAAHKDPETIAVYGRAVSQYAGWLEERAEPADLAHLTRPLIVEWLAGLAFDKAPGTVLIRHKALHLFCRWLVIEGEIPHDPMDGLQQPKAPVQPVPVLEDREITQLLAACAGTSFYDRRDEAMFRVLFDCGVRISELAGLELGDVDLDGGRRSRGADTILVHGKGRKDRVVPFGARTATALDRYLRARRDHRDARSQALWLGRYGALTTKGAQDMVERRAHQAGLEGVHAHRFRHTFAHTWLAQGGQERDLMRLAGWSSEAMLGRYGASLAEERARDAFRRMNLGDRL